MIISCPVCKTKYNIDASIIPLSGKKLRCAKCGEVWKVYPQDWVDFEQKLKKEQEPETLVIEDGIKEDIKASKNIKGSSRNFLISLLKITFVLIFFLSLIFAYVFRYQVVRNFPQTETIYDKLGIESKVVGEGLIFEDILWSEYEDNDIRKMDISGTISNITEKLIDVPLLHIELLDNEGNILQNIDRTIPTEHIIGGGSVPFKTTIVRPAPFTKYIFVTFTKPN